MQIESNAMMNTDKQDVVQTDAFAEKDCNNLDRKDPSFWWLLLRFVRVYWRTFVVVICPIILSPLIILKDTTSMKCLYTIIIMAIYWVTEVLPLPITAFMPVLFFPLLGILSTSETTQCYLNDTTMMFIASLFIAVAIEHSGLHMRIALLIIRTVGCSHRRLTFGIFLVTMLLSMWISNTAASAMVIPIINNVLLELENQGLAPMFFEDDTELGDDGRPTKRPTNTTKTYYMIATYAATLGGNGTIVGTGTNLTFKGIFEARFPNAPDLNFADWMCYAVPPMLLGSLLIWMWLQVIYMGMFRPNSKDAKAINIGKEGERVAENVLSQKYKDLGPITWHEFWVALLFVAVVFLWFFRTPGFVTGWPKYITDISVKDSTAAMFVVIAMFVIPARVDFMNAFNKDSSKRPVHPSPGLLNWKILETKMHWGFLFVLGGGFAVSTAITSSGLSAVIGDILSGLGSLHPVVTLFVVCLLVTMVTELTASVAVANIVLPVVAELAVSIRLHPLYLMVPATFCSCYAFHLPVGTPANAIACGAGHIKTKDLIVAGIGPTVITLVILTITFPTWGNFIYSLNDFPTWAES